AFPFKSVMLSMTWGAALVETFERPIVS
ncbi:hypothetical protein V3C99_015531, partial [Haemonchus contortus]